ncbi:MAG: hypothetical protein LBN11_04170 [Tannerella sp.]|jgi:hypothetical protein|nr:hypothetical protein [Tannerella sp.]
MKVIDAFWEKRNLGVDTVEFVVEDTDGIEVLEEIKKHEKQYNVLKVPMAIPWLAAAVQENGYRFIECSYHAVHNLHEIPMNSIQKRMVDAVSLELMNNDDIEFLFSEIRNGLFDTDRIYNDLFFTHEQAAERYVNWIKDELQRDTELYKQVYKGKIFGFTTLKEISPGVYFPFLSGLYKEYRQSGLGITSIPKIYEKIKEKGGKLYSTYFSSNNPTQLNLHLDCEFKIKKVVYVFVKHR